MTASTSMIAAAQGLKTHVHSGTHPFGGLPLFAKLFKYVSARFMKNGGAPKYAADLRISLAWRSDNTAELASFNFVTSSSSMKTPGQNTVGAWLNSTDAMYALFIIITSSARAAMCGHAVEMASDE